MTTDLEHMLHERLHAELDELVPEVIWPRPTRNAPGLPTRTPDTERAAARRWRMPLLEVTVRKLSWTDK